MDKRLTIAIDGYSSSGKSTFAREIAKELGYIYIDSGAMYRAATLYCIRKGLAGKDVIDIQGIAEAMKEIRIEFVYNPDSGESETYLNSENVEKEIRGLDVSAHVSAISKISEVRTRLVELQKQMGANRGIVMDGRDIGTTVFPDADLKIFMTAPVDIRAKRRYEELKNKGIDASFEEIRNNIVARDITDENRDISPLRRAGDAVILDNSRMSIAGQMEWVRKLIEEKLHDR